MNVMRQNRYVRIAAWTWWDRYLPGKTPAGGHDRRPRRVDYRWVRDPMTALPIESVRRGITEGA